MSDRQNLEEGEPATPEDWDAAPALPEAGEPAIPSPPAETAKQSIPETALHSFGKGASFGLTDEGRGLMAGAGEASQMMREAVGLEVPSSQRGVLERLISAYRDERGAARKDVEKGRRDNPGTALTAEMLGALMSPAPKAKALPAGVTRLERMMAMGKAATPVGAAYGAGNSEADLTQGDVGGVVRDTAIGGGLSAGAGAILGGALHGPLSKLEGKEREAVEKAETMAREALDAPERSARGALGGAVQSGHRDLEVAQGAQSDALADPAITKALQDFAASPEGIALRNRVLQAKSESLPGKLSEIDAKQAALDAARAANTPEAVEREAARLLGPERFKEATLTRLKRYAGNTIPPAIGASIGALGGPEWAAAGGLLGGVASAAMGTPSRAIANYVRDPSVMLRMSQVGQAPLTDLPIKAASSLTSEEENRRWFIEKLKALGAE